MTKSFSSAIRQLPPLPVVSVIVPCRNRAQFLPATLDSILQQDYPDIECIVVDAASTDGTSEILRRYGESHPTRLRWISEADQGHADALNKGFKMSRGHIVTWLNADDLWNTPHTVRQAVEYLVAHPDVVVVYGDCGSIDDKGNVLGRSYLHEWDLDYAVEFCDHCIPQPASFIRRDALERAGWIDPTIWKKDHEMWLRLALLGRIAHVPILFGFARNIKGISNNGSKAAKGCVQVTRKFYSLAEVPEYLQQKRKRALSNSYLKGAQYAWNEDRLAGTALWYSFRSLLADPTNCGAALRSCARYMKRAIARSQYSG